MASPQSNAQTPTRVSPIDAVFNASAQTTTYTILVAVPPGSPPPVITWSGPACGTFAARPGEPTTFIWVHPHPPCDPTTSHAATTITVRVVSGLSLFVCTYQGAETGAGPACTVTALGGNQSNQPNPVAAVTTTPVNESTEVTTGNGRNTLGWGLGLGLTAVGIGGGIYVYTRSRKREDIDSQWSRALGTEERAQQAILTSFNMMLDRVNNALAAYRAAVDKYRTAYTNALSGSTEMQGMLEAWRIAQQGAKRADMAFAILTLAWGLGSLGLKIARWATTARTAAAAAGEGAAAAGSITTTGEAANLAASGATTVAGEAAAASAAANALRATEGLQAAAQRSGSFFWEYFLPMLGRQQAIRMEKLAAEAGVDLAAWMARHGDDAVVAGNELMKLIARQRGWHGIAPQLEGAIGRLLVNGRGAAAGRMAAMSADDIALLQQAASRPGFWEWLSKSANWIEGFGRVSNTMEQTHDIAVLLYHADDIAFLRNILAAGGDVAKLRALLGPAQTVAVTALTTAPALGGAGVIVGVGGNAGLQQGIGQAWSQAGDPLMQMGDLSNFVDQFGVTDRFTAGQGYWRAVGGELWELVTAPITTIESHYFTFKAQDAYDQFLQNHGDELRTMGSGLNEAIGALNDLQAATALANPNDARNPLAGGREQALRDALNDLRKVYDSADPDWQRAHADEMADRRRHIEDKLAYIRSVMDALTELQQHLPAMIAQLTGLQRDASGNLRPLTTYMNPEITIRLLGTGLALNSTANGITDAAAGPAPGEAAGTAADNAFADLETPLEPPATPSPAPTDEEVERLWQEQMEENARRIAEMESTQDLAYELPDFSDLDAPDAGGEPGGNR